MILLEEKHRARELVQDAMASGARKKQACEVLGISIRALQRWEQACNPEGRKGAGKRVPRKLSEEERQKVKNTACEAAFKDLTPYEIVAILAENGIYIASERTFYRILKADGLLHHRGNGKPAIRTSEPKELVATGPNQIWSWDITWRAPSSQQCQG